MHEAKRFAVDVSITFIASVLSVIFASLIGIILGRYLGPTDLGLYKMAVMFYGIASLIGALGIPASIIKYVAEYRKDEIAFNKIVSSGLITSLAMGLILSMLIYSYSFLFASLFKMPELESLLSLLSPVFFFILLNAALFGVLNGLRQMKKYAAASIFQSILLILLTLILFYFYPSVTSAIAGLVLSAMGTTLFLIIASRKFLHIDLENFIKTTKMLLGFGLQTLGTNLVNMINLQADTFFIGFFLNAKEVGYYAAATGISRFFWVAPQAIQTISYPAISEYWAKRNISGLEIMVDRSMRYAALALIPLGMMMVLFSSEIVTWIYGQEFLYSSLSLQILLLGTIFFGIFFTSIGGALAGANRPDLSLKAASLCAGLTIILNIILVPDYGIVGAAIATTSSLIIFACLYYVLTIRTMRLNLNLKWLPKIIVISLIGVSIYVLLRDLIDQNLLRFCILSIFTGLSVIILFPREDIYLAKSLIRSFKIENIITNLQRRN